MSSQVEVITTRRSVHSYLLSPIARAARRSGAGDVRRRFWISGCALLVAGATSASGCRDSPKVHSLAAPLATRTEAVELYESTREGLSAVCLDVIDSEFAGRVPEGVRNVATPAFRALRRSMPEIRIPAEVVDPVEVLELYYRSGNHESHYFTGTALSEVEISGGTFGCYTAGEVVIERCNRYPCATRAYFIIAARKG